MALSDAIAWLNTQIATVSGIDVATTPKDNIGVNGLISMAYDANGVLEMGPARMGKDLSTIRVLLIYPRSDLAQAIYALQGKPQAIAQLIRADQTLGGYVQTFGVINYQFTVIPWQGIDCLGYTIDITGVKILTSV